MSAPFQNRQRLKGRFPLFTLVFALAPAGMPAQMHHVDAPERVTRALGVYEWTGELNKPTAARFVPVSLFINGAMQDAGLYLARPVPFALQTGDIYALEHAGEPQGLLDLNYAQHVVTATAIKDDDPAGAWYAYGKFTPQTPARVAALHPSARLPVIQADGKPVTDAEDTRPHMTRRSEAKAPPATTGHSDTTTSSTTSSPDASASTDTSAKPGANDGAPASGTGPAGRGSPAGTAEDTDRPTLRHRDPSQDATRKREYGSKSRQASVTAVGPGPGDDPDRPVLGRNASADETTAPLTGLPAGMHQLVGVSDPVHRDQHNFARDWDSPAERSEVSASLLAVARSRVITYLAANSLIPSPVPLPAETSERADISERSAGTPPVTGPVPAGQASTGTSTTGTAPANGTDADDAGAPPKLQRGRPSQYGTPSSASTAAPTAAPAAPAAGPALAGAVNPPLQSTKASGKPRTTHSAAHRVTKTGTKFPATLVLAQSTITGYTLSYGGLPTFVYTAAASVTSTKPVPVIPASAAGVPPAPTPGNAHPAVFVTVVAQRLPSGELQVVLSSVTDSLHLDRGPRLRLVDAVDSDDSHRASLLFELRGASSRQFALYRLTAAQAEQTFSTASIE